MTRKEPPRRDPISEYQRRVTATRRVGASAKCGCGENRPEALVAGTAPIICAACKRRNEGKTTIDMHHVAGKANSPATIGIFVNDHRARVSVDQYDWQPKVLENPDGSPLLRAAACLLGFTDTVRYLLDEFLPWIVELLCALDAFLTESQGRKWWHRTNVENAIPKGWSNNENE